MIFIDFWSQPSGPSLLPEGSKNIHVCFCSPSVWFTALIIVLRYFQYLISYVESVSGSHVGKFER